MNLRSSAPAFVKRLVWNRKFHHPTALSWTAPPVFVESVRQVAGCDGHILDLGCGTATMIRPLLELGWKGRYVGVDVSSEALAIARRCAYPRAEWVLSAIEDYQFHLTFNAICFLESIYYVQPGRLVNVLSNALRALTPDGRILIQICDRKRHSDYVEQIQAFNRPQIQLYLLNDVPSEVLKVT